MNSKFMNLKKKLILNHTLPRNVEISSNSESGRLSCPMASNRTKKSRFFNVKFYVIQLHCYHIEILLRATKTILLKNYKIHLTPDFDSRY